MLSWASRRITNKNINTDGRDVVALNGLANSRHIRFIITDDTVNQIR